MPALDRIAEAHSRDMAGRGTLSHASASGLSYTERLFEARVFFEAAAENVAYSDSFVAAFIHRSLMDSPGHRENILNGEFNRVGIGVVLKEGDGYYVTQDFIRSLGPGLNMENLGGHMIEFEEQTRERINRLRLQQGLPPFEFLEEADALAKEFLERRAAGDSPPVLPPAYRGIHILYVFINAPSLEKAEAEFGQMTQPHTHMGGMGVRFSRSEDAPGGAYEFAFILFLDKNYAAMSPEEHTSLVADQITALRAEQGLGPVQIDPELSGGALQVSRSMKDREGGAAVVPPRLAGFRIESYITANPLDIPDEIASRIAVPGIQNLGLGVVFEPDGDLPTGLFWVTLVYR
jgi:uncharacterized protein YkwD